MKQWEEGWKELYSCSAFGVERDWKGSAEKPLLNFLTQSLPPTSFVTKRNTILGPTSVPREALPRSGTRCLRKTQPSELAKRFSLFSVRARSLHFVFFSRLFKGRFIFS